MKVWILLPAVLFLVNCKTASYEENRERKNQTNQVAPPQGVVNIAVEVLYQGQVIKEVSVNTNVTVRPTTTSIFDALPPNCSNNGFIRIEYDFGDGTNAVVDRKPTGCEEPSVNHLYAREGTYTITMRMTGRDNSLYTATTILTVRAIPQPIGPYPYNPTNPNYPQVSPPGPIIEEWIPCEPCQQQIIYYDPCDPCAQNKGPIRRFFSRILNR